jgi:hypothetical protein
MSSEKRQRITTQYRRNKMREYLTRKIYGGVVFALAIFGTTILAVAISGTIKTWTTGEVLKSADLNTTIASLQTAIQNIPNWTKAANGNDAYYTAGNVGIGTASPGESVHTTKNILAGESTGNYVKLHPGTNDTFLQLSNSTTGGKTWSINSTGNLSGTGLGGGKLFFYGTVPNYSHLVLDGNTGNVGIGTANPSSLLSISGGQLNFSTSSAATMGTGNNGLLSYNQNTGILDLAATAGGYTKLVFSTSNGASAVERMRINESGLVGIGRIPTTHPLEVQGTAGLTSGTAWTNISDERLKDIDGAISSALDNLLKLNPIKYKYNEASGKLFKNADGKSKYGFTAQNVKSVFPEMVITDDKGYLWYNPSGFEAILTSAIKELAFRLRSTSDSVSVVTQKIDSLEKEKAANEKKLLALEESNQKLIEDNKRLRETVETLRVYVETHGRASLRLEDRLRAIENTQMARK